MPLLSRRGRSLAPIGRSEQYSSVFFCRGVGRFGVEVGGVRDDDDPAIAAALHQEIYIAGAVGPVGAVAGFGAGHGPVVVNGGKVGTEIGDGLYLVGAMGIFVEIAEERGVLILDFF